MPCWVSMTSESQPILAITSAEKPLGMPHHPLMTAPPACQISRTRFARIFVPPGVYRRSRQLRRRKSSTSALAFLCQTLAEALDVDNHPLVRAVADLLGLVARADGELDEPPRDLGHLRFGMG